jgi:prevent-host-death family protein
MRYVSETEAKERLGALIETAQQEPVTIRQRERDVAVIVSAEEYRRLTEDKAAAFNRFCDMIGERAEARGLTEDRLAALLTEGSAAKSL